MLLVVQISGRSKSRRLRICSFYFLPTTSIPSRLDRRVFFIFFCVSVHSLRLAFNLSRYVLDDPLLKFLAIWREVKTGDLSLASCENHLRCVPLTFPVEMIVPPADAVRLRVFCVSLSFFSFDPIRESVGRFRILLPPNPSLTRFPGPFFPQAPL